MENSKSGRTGGKLTEAQRERKREREREYWKDPAVRERKRERKREYWKDPAVRERERERAREYWKDPAFRERKRERARQRGYWKDPAVRGRRWELALKRKYNLTAEEYNQILMNQKGGCAICGTAECSTGYRLAVDHCHTAEHRDQKVIRGLLCAHCNTTLGRSGDSWQWFAQCIIYLAKHQAKINVELAIERVEEFLACLKTSTHGKEYRNGQEAEVA